MNKQEEVNFLRNKTVEFHESKQKELNALMGELDEEREKSDSRTLYFLKWKVDELFRLKAELDLWSTMKHTLESDESNEEILKNAKGVFEHEIRQLLRSNDIRTEANGHGISSVQHHEAIREFIRQFRMIAESIDLIDLNI